MNTTSRARQAANALRSAGFPLVVEAVSTVDRAGGVVFDAIAYDVVGRNLEMTTAVVAAASDKGLPLERSLGDLSTARDLFGTSTHYVVAGRQWLLANPGLTAASPVTSPTPAHALRYDGGRVFVDDEKVLTELLRDRLWAIAENMRSTGFDLATATSSLLEELRGSQLRAGNFAVDSDPQALWLALTTTVRRAAEGRTGGLENVSLATVARAVVELLGPLRPGRAFDPFCGLGSFLWEVADRADSEGVDIEMAGCELNGETARLARAVASFAAAPIRVETADSFSSLFATSRGFDYVVSAPPMGSSVLPDQAASFRARRTETAAIALAAESIVEGGRAVLHLSNSWLYNADAAAVRSMLTREYRVLAIIGLPTGLVPGTNLQSNLLVFDRCPSTEHHQTFIAQLGEDWSQQLTPGGGAMTAFLTYLDSGALQ